MKATRLDTIGDNYREAIKTSDIAKGRLVEAQKYLKENQKGIEELEKKLKAVESLDQQREQYKKLQNELGWATVRMSYFFFPPFCK